MVKLNTSILLMENIPHLNTNMNIFKVGDSVNFTSIPFGFRDKNKLWFVIERSDEVISLEADDRFKLTYPHFGKHVVHISSQYWEDIIIKNYLDN